jgi:O-acetyl-ADP-ribose deacetylase (regulator of RNase III)
VYGQRSVTGWNSAPSVGVVKRVRLVHTEGDLLDQDVDAIVNAWNRNLIPWWLLLPQGVSGAIKRRAGLSPFRELRRYGILPLGGAVLTGAGRLPFKGIVHVAGIGHLWRASRESIRPSVANAIEVASREQFRSIAFPLIGAGTGGMSVACSEQIMVEALSPLKFAGEVRLVRFRST